MAYYGQSDETASGQPELSIWGFMGERKRNFVCKTREKTNDNSKQTRNHILYMKRTPRAQNIAVQVDRIGNDIFYILHADFFVSFYFILFFHFV